MDLHRQWLLVVLIGASVAASAAVIPPGTVLDAKQELVRNNGTEPESLDPARVESFVASGIVLDLFEGLTASDPQGNPVPGVAESWKQVDATTWVFKLRATAQWSNGQPVTASDFLYSWRRLVDPKTAAKNASASAAYLLNGPEIVSGRKPPTELGVRAIDKLTLEVKTPGPLPFLPSVLALATLAPQPQAVVEKFGNDWTKPGNMVSNGAYRLKDWQVNSKVVIEKNAGYWDAAHVPLARVTFLCVEDTNADLKLYQSGEEDIVNRIPAGAYESLKAQYPNEMRNSLLWGIRFFALNNADPQLKDVRVRKALSMVLDRDILARKVTADGQAPAYGVAVKGVNGFQGRALRLGRLAHGQARGEARKLIAEAGVKPGTRLKLTYYNSDSPEALRAVHGQRVEDQAGPGHRPRQPRVQGVDREDARGRVRDHQHRLGRRVQRGHAAAAHRAMRFGRQRRPQLQPPSRRADRAGQPGRRSREARGAADAGGQARDGRLPADPTVQYSAPRLVKPWWAATWPTARARSAARISSS